MWGDVLSKLDITRFDALNPLHDSTRQLGLRKSYSQAPLEPCVVYRRQENPRLRLDLVNELLEEMGVYKAVK